MIIGRIINGFLAGLMVSIGGVVFLSAPDKTVGAILFAIALLVIVYKGYSLFTGKIGYMVESHTKDDLSVLLLGLLGNALGTTLIGIMMRYILPNIAITAETICNAKLSQSFIQTLVRAIFCGILMYLAVSVYKENKTVTGLFFAIPVFILSGYEHSIANMFYFGASGIVSFKAFTYILIVILGNTIGGMLFPFLNKYRK